MVKWLWAKTLTKRESTTSQCQRRCSSNCRATLREGRKKMILSKNRKRDSNRVEEETLGVRNNFAAQGEQRQECRSLAAVEEPMPRQQQLQRRRNQKHTIEVPTRRETSTKHERGKNTREHMQQFQEYKHGQNNVNPMKSLQGRQQPQNI